MPPTIKLAEYLFTRLHQLGISSIHGVPGDFNLELLDYITPSNLHWVGNANELNAGYAADGYARIKGLGALVTTFGVGELSALNAIAGAYAERAAVVHIVGTPPRATQDARKLVHHTFNDGEFGRFAAMAAHVTVAQASLRDPRTAPREIDRVLGLCLLESRPVYIAFPADLVAVEVDVGELERVVGVPESVSTRAQEGAVEEVLGRMRAAKRPVILVDGESRPLGIVDSIQELITRLKWPTWSTPFGKGMVDEAGPRFYGIYKGAFDHPEVQEYFKTSDLILCFGPHYSSTNSYSYTSIPRPEATIAFTDTEIRLSDKTFRDIPAKEFMAQLLKRLEANPISSSETFSDFPRDTSIAAASLPSEQAITQDKVWRLLATILRPGDILLAETGTAGHGVRSMPIPPQTRVFVPATWLSIGYMLPAAQGAALAQRELMASSKDKDANHGPKLGEARTVLMIGDGSFQMTVQELSTMIKEDLDVLVVLINNDGFTIERCIHGLEQEYNGVPGWRYALAPKFFGAGEDSWLGTCRTWGELGSVLGDERICGTGVEGRQRGFRMMEVVMEKDDVPEGQLVGMMAKEKKRVEAEKKERGV